MVYGSFTVHLAQRHSPVPGVADSCPLLTFSIAGLLELHCFDPQGTFKGGGKCDCKDLEEELSQGSVRCEVGPSGGHLERVAHHSQSRVQKPMKASKMPKLLPRGRT